MKKLFFLFRLLNALFKPLKILLLLFRNHNINVAWTRGLGSRNSGLNNIWIKISNKIYLNKGIKMGSFFSGLRMGSQGLMCMTELGGSWTHYLGEWRMILRIKIKIVIML
jgi:hypothetical protein